jgi:tellurite resistance-related uncharacterized protein
MQRAITGFQQDAEGHWVAELSCGHGRHIRHNPPLVERPWVQSEAGRNQRLGELLDCVGCDRRELPSGFAPYRRTSDFDEATIPQALRARHDTKAGIWGRIHVSRGSVDYRVYEPFDSTERLAPDAPGIVLPEVPHQLEVIGPVTLHVEFWRRSG